MHKYLCLFVILHYYQGAPAQVVLSEIMFNPAGNERYDEFVEVYNTSTTESVDLAGWLISDSSKYNILLPYQETALLLPQHFAIILVPNYFENSGIYESQIPADALVMTIGNAQFGAYGLKNSDGERVSLHRPDSLLVSAFRYSPDNKDDFSEEKIDLLAGDGAENWCNSIKAGGTPGYKNSATPSTFDIILSSMTMMPEQPSSNDMLSLQLVINNVGKTTADYVEIEVAEQVGPTAKLLFFDRLEKRLAPGDSLAVNVSLSPFEIGQHQLTATIWNALDENRTNDSLKLIFEIVASYAPGAVVMNEIMYDTDEKSEEWLELFNASTKAIQLKEWCISDKRKSVALSDTSLILPAGGYCVLTNLPLSIADSAMQIVLSLPELNNSGDELALRDATGAVIDSVAYTKETGGARNISVERIRSEISGLADNWGSCVDSLGSTPGRKNSISPKTYDAAIMGGILNISPLKPIAGEPLVVGIAVNNAGREHVENITIKFSYAEIISPEFMTLGSKNLPLLNVDESAIVTAQWNNAPSGVFIIRAVLELANDMVVQNNAALDTVFISDPEKLFSINEIMYSPAEGMAEWIEVVNICARPVQLFGCALGKVDSSERFVFGSEPMKIESGGFFVSTEDSSLINICDAPIFVSSKMPSLKNDADSIYIFDANGRVIDFVHYVSEWGGAKGRSLERINPNVSSLEQTNWTTCVSKEGHTAGAKNSVTIDSMPEAVSLEVLPNPFSPDGDGINDFAGISYSLPATTAQVNLKIYDINGRIVRFLLNNEASSASRTIFWDGLNDAGRLCRIGVYIVFFEALNETAMCIERAKTTVVLAGTL